MRLYLISVLLLLVPLATAESVAKFLYSREGSNDYMISESYNATSVSSEVKSNSNDGFLFAAQNDRDDQFYNLVLNGRRFRDTESFAVEAFSNENRNSSESLKHLIVSVYGTIIVRHLTGDERSQLEAYKRTQTKKMNFKVIRKGVHLKIEACGFTDFRAAIRSPNARQRKGNLFLFQIMEPRDSTYFIHKAGFENETRNMSLVIESRPDRTGRFNHECERDPLPNLTVKYCEGQLGLKGLTDED